MTHDEAERRLLSLIEEAALPRPDEIERWPGELAFFWNPQKVCVIVELGEDDLTVDELRSIVPAGMAG